MMGKLKNGRDFTETSRVFSSTKTSSRKRLAYHAGRAGARQNDDSGRGLVRHAWSTVHCDRAHSACRPDRQPGQQLTSLTTSTSERRSTMPTRATSFAALERLDTEVRQHTDDVDEPELDTFYQHFDDAQFSLGDFELRYRMHHRAGRAIRAVLEAAVDDAIRNDAAYRLARHSLPERSDGRSDAGTRPHRGQRFRKTSATTLSF